MQEQDIKICLSLITHEGKVSPCSAPREWKYTCGVTKGCFIIPGLSYVIKFRKGKCPEDFCLMEYENYQLACKLRIERILPKTWFLGNINGINFIAQEKINYSFNDMPSDHYQQIVEKTSNTDRDYVNILGSCFYEEPDDYVWLKLATLFYGRKFMRTVAKWTHMCCINDLHRGNIGFLKKRPVILDFSGYF